MNKRQIITLSLIAFSSTTLACGGDVHMSIPHIHDEADMLNSVKNAHHSKLMQTELKQIDIHQIFAGKLEKHHHEVVSHEKEIKAD
ncbi:hypothetical protein [Shewanella donghaensis]|uniref:hypothetical protein n=1 Tax=Shewanella donghaensis TaxID=238836 RepID=UPI001183E3B4|nr:hypothetical protein [Shewanella donghaensis]